MLHKCISSPEGILNPRPNVFRIFVRLSGTLKTQFMKIILLLYLVCITPLSFGQESREEMADSKIYVRATFFDQKNEIIGLQLRTDLGDTSIDQRHYLKFKQKILLIIQKYKQQVFIMNPSSMEITNYLTVNLELFTI